MTSDAHDHYYHSGLGNKKTSYLDFFIRDLDMCGPEGAKSPHFETEQALKYLAKCVKKELEELND